MEFAVFQTPVMRPERTPREVFDWAVEQAAVAEQAGCTEYWVGEHATLNWESIPSPELVLAAAVRSTSTIKLCPGAHLLPYHNPATLAVQTSWMSHLAQGRYLLGVGAGAYRTDAALRGLGDMSENHDMMTEAFDIMERVWAAEPFHYEGKYFKAGYPEVEGEALRDLRPWGGEMPIAMAGFSPNSATMSFAGQRGFVPLSFAATDGLVTNHWDLYSAAAAQHGHTVSRDMHHVAREVFCADTDREARDLAINGPIGRAWIEYFLPQYKVLGIFDMVFPGVPASDIDVEYIADHLWIVGSPDTVVEKLDQAVDASGGWGTTMLFGHDFIDDPAPWEQSLRLLVSEVGPRVESA